MKKLLHIFISIVLIAGMSCTISKRHYRHGFYFSWHAKKVTAPREKKQTVASKEPDKESPGLVLAERIVSQVKPLLFASIDKPSNLILQKKQIKVLNDSCGDLMTFRDGSEQFVRILEASDDFVKYKPCNNLDGPIRTTKSENVFMIRYLGGRKRVFKENVQITTIAAPIKHPVRKRTNGFAVASFICAMLSFLFIPAIPALVFGVISSEQMKRHPDTYKGKWMATIGLIVGGIMTFILAIILLANA